MPESSRCQLYFGWHTGNVGSKKVLGSIPGRYNELLKTLFDINLRTDETWVNTEIMNVTKNLKHDNKILNNQTRTFMIGPLVFKDNVIILMTISLWK